MTEFLLLLLPLAAASGWWAANRSAKKADRDRKKRADPTYFKGINYVLNEQPDKAIDLFIKLLEVDSETVETHLALGNLFRRRGEVERAIRIHQNLIARPALDQEQRSLALLELGLDYMQAGLFDRAEGLFEELVDNGAHQQRALSSLRAIYEHEKAWEKCLQVTRRLEILANDPQQKTSAHYYCELADEAIKGGDSASATKLLRKAQKCDYSCVRAAILLGQIEMNRGEYRSAIRAFHQVAGQDTAFFSEILPMLTDCYKRLEDRNGLWEFLRKYHQRHHHLAAGLALVDLIEEKEGQEAAVTFIANHLAENPDLKGLNRLVQLYRNGGGLASDRPLETIRRLLESLVKEQPSYRCVRCGFTAKTLHWLCPGCRGWGKIKPAEGLSVGQSNE